MKGGGGFKKVQIGAHGLWMTTCQNKLGILNRPSPVRRPSAFMNILLFYKMSSPLGALWRRVQVSQRALQ